jgi:hypothetical protein
MVERREQLYGLQLAFAASICSCEQVHRPGPKQKLTLEFSVHSSGRTSIARYHQRMTEWNVWA